MRMISEADAFRGRWAVHPIGWLITLLPLGLLVALQESLTPFDSGWAIVASALTQHVVAGGLIVGVGSLVYRARGAVPLAFTAALWVGSGALRGLIGGWFAVALAGAAPDYALRVAYWVLATLVWMPLLTYLLAQFDFHRQLQQQLDLAGARLEAEHATSRLSIEEGTTALIAAVRDAVAPLIDDARRALTLAADDRELSLSAISSRLEAIADGARAVIAQPGSAEPAPPAPSVRWSPLIESIAFSRARPIFLSLLVCLAVAALYLVDSYRVGGAIEVLEHAASIAVGGVTLALTLTVARRARRFAPVHAVIVFLCAGVATQLTLLVVDVDMSSLRDRAMIIAIPIGFIASTRIIASAVGLGLGNLKLVAALEQRHDELSALIESSQLHRAEIARKVSIVLHGPLLGRLSACIMALNFYLDEPPQSRALRRPATTEGVLAHLELVAEDLKKIVPQQP
jgi:hypothetical protein